MMIDWRTWAMIGLFVCFVICVVDLHMKKRKERKMIEQEEQEKVGFEHAVGRMDEVNRMLDEKLLVYADHPERLSPAELLEMIDMMDEVFRELICVHDECGDDECIEVKGEVK